MNDVDLLASLIEQQEIKESCDKTEICVNCDNNYNILHDTRNALIVCGNCGNVINTIMDDSPEWRHYEDNLHDVSRCSMPINYLLPQSSLSTTIGGKGKNRLKILHSWNAMPYKERSFNIILKKIEEICRKGCIEKIIEDDAKILCKQVIQGSYENDITKIKKNIIIRGLHRNSIIAGAIFFACRRYEKSRSPKEIAEIANIDYTNVTSGCTAFSKFAEFKKTNFDFGSSTSEHFIKRYCHDLHLDKKFITDALHFANNIKLLNIASAHTPISIATGCILLVAEIHNIEIDKKQIKDTFNISEVTINKTLKNLQKYKQLILNDEAVKIVAEELKMMCNKQKINIDKTHINEISKLIDDELKNINYHIKKLNL